jgi:predicted dehydrogenase
MKIAILGGGVIGERRGLQLDGHNVVGVYDPDSKKSSRLSEILKTKTWSDPDHMLEQSDADIVIVATTNDQLTPMAIKAVEAKKHVLVEKPGAITLDELTQLEAAAVINKVAVKVGFNHRFHPAILKARALVDLGALGKLMFLRGRYGHGARLHYEKEWRANPLVGGGGELMDQGVHMLDLIYWFMGPLPLQSSMVTTSFWKMEVDDNAVLTLKDEKKWATFHVSCSEWKNNFALEIYGETGKLTVQGLGRSYGPETLTYYKMSPEMGPPETTHFDFPTEDHSWYLDMENLVSHIKKGTPLLGDISSARYALTQVREAYRNNGFLSLPCSV